MKYYLIAGEASGDLHASNLMKALKEKDPDAEFRFWGGELMQSVGGTMVTHYQELAFMGIWEVLKNINTLSKYIKKCKIDIEQFKPDVLIMVDYSGFNLRIAPFAKSIGIPTHFYIAPKLWAWNEKRVKKLKKYIDELYVIFPFEKEFFEEKHQYPVHFVGNPLQDVIVNRPPVDENKFRKKYHLGDKPVIALLPGSRTQEISKMLPLMAEMSPHFTDYQFVIAGAPNREQDFYNKIIPNNSLLFVPNLTYDLLSIAYAALVTSGTATLETALFKVPQVVCYKTSAFTYFIGKNFISKNLKYISLVNLVANAPLATELLQYEFTKSNLIKELQNILDPENRKRIFEEYLDLEEKLGGKGASERVAEILINKIK
jgi:lipid-A-disaccharide synthase